MLGGDTLVTSLTKTAGQGGDTIDSDTLVTLAGGDTPPYPPSHPVPYPPTHPRTAPPSWLILSTQPNRLILTLSNVFGLHLPPHLQHMFTGQRSYWKSWEIMILSSIVIWGVIFKGDTRFNIVSVMGIIFLVDLAIGYPLNSIQHIKILFFTISWFLFFGARPSVSPIPPGWEVAPLFKIECSINYTSKRQTVSDYVNSFVHLGPVDHRHLKLRSFELL